MQLHFHCSMTIWVSQSFMKVPHFTNSDELYLLYVAAIPNPNITEPLDLFCQGDIKCAMVTVLMPHSAPSRKLSSIDWLCGDGFFGIPADHWRSQPTQIHSTPLWIVSYNKHHWTILQWLSEWCSWTLLCLRSSPRWRICCLHGSKKDSGAYTEIVLEESATSKSATACCWRIIVLEL